MKYKSGTVAFLIGIPSITMLIFNDKYYYLALHTSIYSYDKAADLDTVSCFITDIFCEE